MRILVACEFSGIVREAFSAKGHDAWSCDLIDTEIPGQHIIGNVLEILDQGWDMMIAHPPCTYLTVTANRSFLNNPERWEKRLQAIKFVYELINCCNIPKICIENPVGVISTYIRQPNQYIQPYEFGHKETKKTGLWLKNLPKIIPTKIVEPVFVISGGKKYSKTHYYNPSGKNEKNRKNRNRTFSGIAEAMADQWGTSKEEVK
jgi:hypothetical protein